VNYRHVDVFCGKVAEDDIKIRANTGKESVQLRNVVSFDKEESSHKLNMVVDIFT
jgi:hypothetical protein